MKKFRYELGHEAGETLTVGELVDKLSEYPSDMPVISTWERVYTFIGNDDFSTEYFHKGEQEDRELCLIIDADQY